MSSSELENILKSSPKERYDYFIKNVFHKEEIWLMNDDVNYIQLSNDDSEFIPLWPSKESAQIHIKNDWKDLEVSSFLVWEFITWCDDLKADGIKLLVFPDQDLNGYLIDAETLQNDLSEEGDKHLL